MPEEMAEKNQKTHDMPERMSEEMAERMSEDASEDGQKKCQKKIEKTPWSPLDLNQDEGRGGEVAYFDEI